MDSDTRKIIFLAVLALIILILLLFYIFSGMGSSGQDGPGDQVGTFPIGQTSTSTLPENPITDIPVSTTTVESPDVEPAQEAEEKIVVKESDWRDDVVEYSEPSAGSGYNSGSNSDLNDVQSPYSRDDLNLVEYNMNVFDYAPATFKVGDRGEISADDLLDPEKFREAMTEGMFPQVADDFSSPDYCGTLTLPEDPDDLEKYLNNLDKKDEVKCMGQVFIDDCASTELKIKASTNQSVYITMREDGKCALGVGYQIDFITLCSIEGLLNTSSASSRTFSQWQSYYKNDPGEAFTALYEGYVSQKGVTTDCQNTQVY